MRIDRGMMIVVLAGALTGASCDENLASLAGPTPNLQPTLSSIEREIFNTTDSSGRQSCTSCHTDAGGRVAPVGMVLLTGRSYASLVNVASRNKAGAVRVIPGDPENSYLVHKLEGRSGMVGVRMPRGDGPFLTDGQMLIIKRWIALGAPND